MLWWRDQNLASNDLPKATWLFGRGTNDLRAHKAANHVGDAVRCASPQGPFL